jgi:hypothetical protein
MAAPTGLTRSAALALLGLSAQASRGEVTQAYRRFAKATHPDIAGPGDPDAARRFAALTEAYHVLTLTPATPSRPVPPPRPRPSPVRVRFAQQPPIVARPVRVTSPAPSPTAPRPA